MSGKEVLEAIWKYIDNDPKSTIIEVNNLISDITENPKKLALDLSISVEEFSEYVNRCPLCGEEIEEATRDEEKRMECSSNNCSYSTTIIS